MIVKYFLSPGLQRADASDNDKKHGVTTGMGGHGPWSGCGWPSELELLSLFGWT